MAVFVGWTISMRKAESESLRLKDHAKDAGLRRCDAPGCPGLGEHRAPKARDRLYDYYWFCLDHVREYNRHWNYYEGASPDELEREIRSSTTWERPTWPLGVRRSARRITIEDLHDPFGVLNDDELEAAGARARNRPAADTAEAKAFAVMGLQPPLTEVDLKARYKALVKKHHPDANGGDKQAEERLKLINEAYTTLKKFLS